jgi:hypothetical protein
MNNKNNGFSCMDFSCSDDCCRYGAYITPKEYTRLIRDNKASRSEFIGPKLDLDGDVWYRTRIGPRGCALLLPQRGCRLHGTDYKPNDCLSFPVNINEAETAYNEGYLPCYNYIKSQNRY